MKNLNYWILLLMVATSCLTLTSCGDDDDEGNGTVKTCQVDTGGRKLDFQYAYFTREGSGGSYGYSYALEFTNTDYASISKNPSSIIGKKMSSVIIGFNSPNKYDANSLPEGEILYSFQSSSGRETYDEFYIGINATINKNGDEYCEQCYEADWNRGYESGNLIISKMSEGLYKIEIKNINLIAATPGEFEAHDKNGPKTTGSFYFEGRFEDTSDFDLD